MGTRSARGCPSPPTLLGRIPPRRDAQAPLRPESPLPWYARHCRTEQRTERDKIIGRRNVHVIGLEDAVSQEPWTILAAIDGTPITYAILDLAADEAISHGGTLTLLYVRQPPPVRVISGPTPMGVQLPGEGDQECDKILEEAAVYLAKRGVHAEMERCDGYVRREIVRRLSEGRYDAVAVGCHGHRFPNRMLHGCTSAYLAKHALRPVYTAHGGNED
jgi:nucleotide-binding universal stress UspA family protein